MQQRKFPLPFSLAVALPWLGIGVAAFAAVENPATVRSTLDAVSSSASEAVELEIVDGARAVTVGDPLGYRLRSEMGGYCYLLHVDSRDRATLIRPDGCVGTGSSGGSVSAVFPTSGSLTADYPAGEDVVYGVLSPLPLDAFDSLLGTSALTVLTVNDAQMLASDLAQSAAADEVAIATLAYVVAEAAPETQYTTRGIIRKVVAGMEEPEVDGEFATFDLENIQFDFGSDELTEYSKRQLDVFGAALQSSELTRARLRVAGHTDDIGDEAFNDQLSIRRANSVRAYLMAEFGLEAERLEAVGYGEQVPMTDNETAEARALNRRVEMVFLSR